MTIVALPARSVAISGRATGHKNVRRGGLRGNTCGVIGGNAGWGGFTRRRCVMQNAGSAENLLGGGGGGSGSGGGVGTGGSGGGGGSNFEEKSGGTGGLVGYLVDGWRRRVLADSEFPFKLLTEQVLGVLLGCVGDMVTRPNYGLGELDFVLAFAIIASIVNFSLVWALAPVAASKAGATSGFSLIPSALTKGCPQSHMFEQGAFTILQRLRTFLAKTITFSFIGGAGGLSGGLVTLGLIESRKKLNPKADVDSKEIKIVPTTSAWMLHVGVSSNLRYNILNGMDMILAPLMSSSLFKAYSVIIRSGNNVIGGTSAAICQKITGAQ